MSYLKGEGSPMLSRYNYSMLYISIVHIVLFYLLLFLSSFWCSMMDIIHYACLGDSEFFFSFFYLCILCLVLTLFIWLCFDSPSRCLIMLLSLLKMRLVSLTCLSSLFRAWNRASFDGLSFPFLFSTHTLFLVVHPHFRTPLYHSSNMHWTSFWTILSRVCTTMAASVQLPMASSISSSSSSFTMHPIFNNPISLSTISTSILHFLSYPLCFSINLPSLPNAHLLYNCINSSTPFKLVWWHSIRRRRRRRGGLDFGPRLGFWFWFFSAFW